MKPNPELLKDIVDRRDFYKRVGKFSNEKGDNEYKTFMFDVRKFAKHHKSFLEFLHWLENLKAELTPQLLVNKAVEKPEWNVSDLNRQLYGVLSECAIGVMKGKVVAYEKEVTINGAKICRDLARQHLDGSQAGLAAIGQRVAKPSRATMEDA